MAPDRSQSIWYCRFCEESPTGETFFCVLCSSRYPVQQKQQEGHKASSDERGPKTQLAKDKNTPIRNRRGTMHLFCETCRKKAHETK